MSEIIGSIVFPAITYISPDVEKLRAENAHLISLLTKWHSNRNCLDEHGIYPSGSYALSEWLELIDKLPMTPADVSEMSERDMATERDRLREELKAMRDLLQAAIGAKR